jgi:thioredoxin-dependent peroxiredoxin
VESCGFRDIATKFPKGTVIVGASADKMEEQDKFIATNKLPFALLCDTDLKLIKELGIQISGKEMAQRVTFVVDGEGKIAKVFTEVKKLKEHPDEVLKFVEEMGKKK